MDDIVVRRVVDGDVVACAAIRSFAGVPDIADPHADPKVDVLRQRRGDGRGAARNDSGLVKVRRPAEHGGIQKEQILGRRVVRTWQRDLDPSLGVESPEYRHCKEKWRADDDIIADHGWDTGARRGKNRLPRGAP